MGDNTNVIKNSKIFNSAVSFTREDNHWPYNISTRGMVRTTVTCFFSHTVTSLEPLFTKDLFGTTSKKLVFHQCYPRVLEDIFLSLRIWHTVSLRTA